MDAAAMPHHHGAGGAEEAIPRMGGQWHPFGRVVRERQGGEMNRSPAAAYGDPFAVSSRACRGPKASMPTW